MFAENGTSQVETKESDTAGSSELSERGYYGRALREGQVRQPPPGAPRTVNMLLWVFNLVVWLLVAGFMSWQLYAIYLTGGRKEPTTRSRLSASGLYRSLSQHDIATAGG